jgi:hypothetical protein
LASVETILHSKEVAPVILLSNPRRPSRPHEWSKGKAVTFIVTLAATRSVTLAARAAGMSRKAAYALKSRDPAFASAWNAAIAANRPTKPQGNKVEEIDGPLFSPGQGNRRSRRLDAQLRDRFFSSLTANRSAPVARRQPLP